MDIVGPSESVEMLSSTRQLVGKGTPAGKGVSGEEEGKDDGSGDG